MYTFLKTIGFSKFVAIEAPALFVALLLSELLYKFGSFMIECVAFLATWYVISYFLNSAKIFPRITRRRR
jgi:hypothetical protein